MIKTKKAYKEYLNTTYQNFKWSNNRMGQRKRGYGDYLYSADKIRFDMEYEQWKRDKKGVKKWKTILSKN